LEILSDETADTKANYYEKFFLKSTKENCDLLMRIAYRLSNSIFKQSVTKLDIKDYKEANRLIHKARQYYNQYLEFYEKYGGRYCTLGKFKILEDPEFLDSIKKQIVHAEAHLEFA
jgi:hypothetical protein